jgi:hypothetical protein
MNVYQRPLFRQAGGPAQPMPSDMMPPQAPPMSGQDMAMVEQAQQQGMMQGQDIGAQYAQQMMQQVDQAESAEDLINALRGNQKSLEARRQELGSFVGMEDASATPESVLAMVQPVIMMTEEGAMDSGIGELMQSMVGDVVMSDEMGQGVGGLMAAGVPEAPAPQNFRQGGAVQNYALGGPALMPSAFAPMLEEDQTSLSQMRPVAELPAETEAPVEQPTAPASRLSDLLTSETLMGGGGIKGYYNEMLPLFQDILGSTESQKDYGQGQTYFDIAKSGLALASGVDPTTGQNMAGRSFASQLASAAAPALTGLQERAGEQRQLDQSIKTAALEQALKRSDAETSFGQDLLLARIAAAAKGSDKGLDERVVLDSEGNEIAVLNVNNPGDFAAYQDYQKNPELTFRKLTSDGAEDLQNYVIQYEDGRRELVESFTNGRTYINDEGKSVQMPRGPGISVIKPGAEEVAQLQSNISTQTRYQRKLDDYLAGENPSPSTALISNNARVANSQLMTSAAQNKDKIEQWTGEDLELGYSPVAIKDAQNMAYDAAVNATGPVNFVQSGLNNYLGFLGTLSEEGQDRETQRAYLRAVRFIGKVALVSNSRFPVAEMVLASELFPDPDRMFTDPETEVLKLDVIRGVTDQLYEHNLRELASGNLTGAEKREAEASLRQVDMLRGLLGDVPDLADSDEKRERDAATLRGFGTGIR